MSYLQCSDISGFDCDWDLKLSKIKIIQLYLSHFNEIHDPTFIPRCKDDLFAEYDELIQKIKKLKSLSDDFQ